MTRPAVDILDEFAHDGLTYLNHAGVAPLPRRSVEAIRALADQTARSGNMEAKRWEHLEARLRERLARLTNAPSTDDIALVKNTSEGLSFVAYGLDWKPGDSVVINTHEFPSNRIVWESLAARFGVEVRDVAMPAHGDPEQALIDAIDATTKLVAVSSVQYGTGLRMDLDRLGSACRDRDVLLCVDAIQSLGAITMDVQQIPVDFLVADGHKWMLGPDGLGVFYTRPEARERLQLTQYGWHMVANAGDYDTFNWTVAPSAQRFEPGSLNMLGVVALEASLSLLEEIGMTRVEAQVLASARHLIDAVQEHPALELVSVAAPGRHAGIVTFRIDGRDPKQVHSHLMDHGIVCASRAGGIRFSPHFYNTFEQLDEALREALRA